MSNRFAKYKKDYIIWQNRAFNFYLAARLLHQRKLYGPAAFCANQALELLLKATLIYCDRSFNPKQACHSFKKLLNGLNNKVRGADRVIIPDYFYYEGRYQCISRYPKETKGLGIPGTFLEDLDRVFCDLVHLVPFQFNSQLMQALERNKNKNLLIMRRHNKQMRRMRKFLKPWMRSGKNI